MHCTLLASLTSARTQKKKSKLNQTTTHFTVSTCPIKVLTCNVVQRTRGEYKVRGFFSIKLATTKVHKNVFNWFYTLITLGTCTIICQRQGRTFGHLVYFKLVCCWPEYSLNKSIILSFSCYFFLYPLWNY